MQRISLIEYSAFSGSLDIFTYLINCRAEIGPPIWIYAIQGRNYEIIHLIEEKSVEYPCQSYRNLIKKSILCHHNELTEYFLANWCMTNDEKNSLQENNMSNESENDEDSFLMDENLRTYHYDKIYEHFSNKYLNNDIFYILCKGGICDLVEIFLELKEININDKYILSFLLSSDIHLQVFMEFTIIFDFSPLYIASQNCHIDIVKILVEQDGIDINIKNDIMERHHYIMHHSKVILILPKFLTKKIKLIRVIKNSVKGRK